MPASVAAGPGHRYPRRVDDAFYVPADSSSAPGRSGRGRFVATDATTSPWDERAQHGGPPAALLATCIEASAGGPGLRLARLSVDFLGPIPKGDNEVAVEVVRPGRRTQLTQATLSAEGRVAVVARAWHLAVSGDPGPAPSPAAELPAERPQQFFPGLQRWGYGESVEWRFVEGGFDVQGRADVWTRVRVPLVAGTELTGLQRLLIVADSANGISAPFDLNEWLFIPPGITVHLTRFPVGPWVRMRAASDPGADGIGLTEARLGDGGGECGVATQPILVAPRQRA